MSEGEAQLRYDIYLALMKANAIGDPDQIAYYIDEIIEAVKRQWIYVTCGEIMSVRWDNINWVDGVDEPFYDIKVEDISEEEYGDGDFCDND